MTYELGVPRKKPAMETAPTCPTNTASLSDESKCADYAKMAGKSFNTADLPNYPRGCSDRIDHPQFAGVWWNSAKGGTWDQQEGTWWNQHPGFTGEVALVCEPTMPHLTTCDDHLAQALTAYWEYGDCGYWGNDYNQGLCGGLLSGDCPEFWDKPENSDYIIFSEAEKMWQGISAEIKCVRAQLKSFVTSTAFTQERIFTSDGKGNRKGNIGEAVSWKGAKCNSNCHYLWHAQYECVETVTTTTTTTVGPLDAAAGLVAMDTKCHFGGASSERLFRLAGQASLEECQARCRETPRCKFYSWAGGGQFAQVCMGCHDAQMTSRHPGFSLHALHQADLDRVSPVA